MRRVVKTLAVDLRALVEAPTGIGIYTLALLRELQTGAEGRTLGLAHRQPSVWKELERLGIEIDVRRAPFGVWWQQLTLPRRLRRGDIDLFWSPLMTLPPDPAVPSVVTVHDLTPLLFPETHRLKVRWSLYPFLQRSLEQATRIVAVSQATANDLRQHFPQCADRIRVVLNGVDPEFVPASADQIAATRSELQTPNGYFFYAGTIEPRKNVGLLLDAWASLREQDAQVPPLLLAGPYGWGSKRLIQRIRGLQDCGVRYLGRVQRPQLVRLMQAARVFVYPSLYEGFGLPAAEAMACGVPTVVSSSSSLPEVVGDAGLVVDPHDAEELRGALGQLLREPSQANDLALRGLERARLFRWSRAANEMRSVFDEALKEI